MAGREYDGPRLVAVADFPTALDRGGAERDTGGAERDTVGAGRDIDGADRDTDGAGRDVDGAGRETLPPREGAADLPPPPRDCATATSIPASIHANRENKPAAHLDLVPNMGDLPGDAEPMTRNCEPEQTGARTRVNASVTPMIVQHCHVWGQR